MAVRARAQADLDLDRRVAAAVEDLARVDALDLAHDVATLDPPLTPSPRSIRRARLRSASPAPLGRAYLPVVDGLAGVEVVGAGVVLFAPGAAVEVVFGAL